MLFELAWRNIWRSKIRSFALISSIVIGVWSILFILAFTIAVVDGYVDDAIESKTSHLQIHHPNFVEDREVKYLIASPENKLAEILQRESVKAATLRTIVNAMASSSYGAEGVIILGVDAEREAQVTRLENRIVEGKYFVADKKNQIIVNEKLAEKLHLNIRKKVVLQFQDLDHNITSGAFRVVGITAGGNVNDVMIQRHDLNRLLGKKDAAHELAIYLKDTKTLETTGVNLKNSLPNLLIQNYREIAPDVQMYESQIGATGTIITTVFMLSLIFGIINTMLMVVLERNKELGMLMAVGMNKVRVFGLIVLETLMLSLVAVPIGLAISYFTIQFFGQRGIDLGAFSEGIEKFGMASQIFPALTSDYYLYLAFTVLLTALLASLYPAWKAVRLRPIEAMSKI